MANEDDGNNNTNGDRAHPAGTSLPSLAYPVAESREIGRAVEFACPSCGEQLWVYLPTDMSEKPTILRRSDIPKEDDGEGEDA